MIIDRFRSFIHVQITETGLIHTPWQEWKKQFVLILTMGSSDDSDAQPVVDLFDFMTSILGPENELHLVKATRLAMAGQLTRSAEDMKVLYDKMKLPLHLAIKDHLRNSELLAGCTQLGFSLTKN
jgi:hypothetical protein